MEDMKQEDVRKLIGSFYKKNYHSGKVFTLKHFRVMGVSKSTIFRTIQRYEEGIDEKRKVGSGQKTEKFPPVKDKCLVEYADMKKEVTVRKLASKYNISKSYAAKVLQKNNVQYRKRKSCPCNCPLCSC